MRKHIIYVIIPQLGADFKSAPLHFVAKCDIICIIVIYRKVIGKERNMVIEGVVEDIIYKNAENGYCVLRLETKDDGIVAVGTLPLVSEGETLELEGDYTEHKTYGRQFSVTSFRSRMPADETAILRYLSSGIVKGIREKTAKALISVFGPDTLDILENEPERVCTVKGISRQRAETISQSLKETVGVKTILLYFQQFGITPSVAFRIFKQWGLRSYDIIKSNPYRLCEIPGVGFQSADRIAVRMGYDSESSNRVEAALIFVLNHNMYGSGHTFLPKRKLCDIVSALLGIAPDTVAASLERLIADGVLAYVPEIGNSDAVYQKWVYESERTIALRTLLMAQFSGDDPQNFNGVVSLAERRLGIEFDELQKKAIFAAVKERVLLLTGGPGTGKTTTLNGIIRVFESEDISFALCAPTGRAAKRISELTGREAKTLHRLLEYAPRDGEYVFNRNKDNQLQYDAVIADESSMIDLSLFSHLLEALPLKSKLILVGDAAQLPPVGAGNVFRDLLECGYLPTVRLDRIFRQAQQSLIVTNAHEILNGRMPVLNAKDRDFFFIPTQSADALHDLVRALCTTRLPNAYGFDAVKDIQVLSPTRKGSSGTAALNETLRDALNPADGSKKELPFRGLVFREGDKVMQIRNDYDLVGEKPDGDIENGIFNGDIGTIEKIDTRSETLSARFDDRLYTYSVNSSEIEELEPAYAITVHKSQGSEFDAVVLPLFEGPELLYTRNLLYTAVTRAKKILIIVGDVRKVKYMVDNARSNKRYSGLKHWMKKFANATTEEAFTTEEDVNEE